LCTRKTSEFLEEFQVHIAINGDGFTYLNPPPEGLCATGDPIIPNGFAASRGKVYSTRRGPTVYINQKNEVSFNQVKGALFNAVSGDRMVLVKGQQVPNLATNNINPRTAVGLSKNERVLILVVVDGRQEGASEGVSFPELADLMASFGAYTAINMDGGGSSALVIKGADGKPRVLNTPIDDNLPGKERSVANHLGIFIKK
jgi:exopolysaccharide biosynthesis protein